jgi:hypothetical protein
VGKKLSAVSDGSSWKLVLGSQESADTPGKDLAHAAGGAQLPDVCDLFEKCDGLVPGSLRAAHRSFQS